MSTPPGLPDRTRSDEALGPHRGTRPAEPEPGPPAIDWDGVEEELAAEAGAGPRPGPETFHLGLTTARIVGVRRPAAGDGDVHAGPRRPTTGRLRVMAGAVTALSLGLALLASRQPAPLSRPAPQVVHHLSRAALQQVTGAVAPDPPGADPPGGTGPSPSASPGSPLGRPSAAAGQTPRASPTASGPAPGALSDPSPR